MSFQLDSIRLKNLRSLQDTGRIELKPITILVGKNSVGKSTFLRSFPLLRQSCEKQKRAPILWFGKLVDFGDFDTTINREAKNDKDNSVCFCFEFSKRNVSSLRKKSNNFDYIYENLSKVSLEFKLKSDENTTFLSDILLNLDGREIHFEYELYERSVNFLKRISINGVDLLEQNYYDQIIDAFQNQFLPRMEGNFLSLDSYYFELEDELVNVFDFEKPTFVVLSDLLKNLYNDGNLEINSEFLKGVLDLGIIIYKNKKNINELDDLRGFIFENSLKYVDYNFFEIISKEENLFKILEVLNLDEYIDLILIIDTVLENFYKNVRYLEPLRATAQRYYRRQELSIDEIDSKGANVAMFLDNLNLTTQQDLKSFIQKYFGIEVNVKKEGGHLALTICNNELKTETNIADLGVGYSQLLPFLIQLWDMSLKVSREDEHFMHRLRYDDTNFQSKFLLIEQPELHLHPAYQARIVDVIVDLVNLHESNRLGVILETHSPNIIYRISELIENEILDHSKIQILIFEESENGNTKIRTSSFDKEGDLINWSTGFFQV
jgi:predicted ATPase